MKDISWNFWIKYFHLILTKISCITLEIHSKADFKSKSQNIWQQIILFSRTVMQMICTWPKIWTLSGRLSLMLMKKMSDASKNIFRVYHIRIIAPKKKWITRHETDIFLNNHCQECVRAYSASMIVYLFVARSWSAIIGTKQPKVNQSPQQWRGR